MKKITLLAALFVAFTMNAQVTVWEDGFESYFDFDVDFAGDWSFIDVDASNVYSSADFNFANEGYTGSAIVFNATAMDDEDPANPADRTAWLARTGDKGLYAFAATSLLNDDYIITPALDLSGTLGNEITFWARSVTDAFGLERFEVLLSTTGTAAADFTVDLGGGELQAPLDYTEYNYDLSAYDGQTVYVAIRYVAQDSFVFEMDDFSVTAASLSVGDEVFAGLSHAVTATDLTLRANAPLEAVSLFNVLGQEVVSQRLSNTNETVNISALTAGVYIAKVTIDGQSTSFKIEKR